jgi:hypothetical protein
MDGCLSDVGNIRKKNVMLSDRSYYSRSDSNEIKAI